MYTDDHRLRSKMRVWLGRRELVRAQAEAVADLIIETGDALSAKKAIAKLPGDPVALRGLPCHAGARSVGGAQKGTRPDRIDWDGAGSPSRRAEITQTELFSKGRSRSTR